MNVASTDIRIQVNRARPAFVYRHIVSFEETNVVGNVYFTRHLAWQGRCREMFLKEHAPEVLSEITRELRLVTLRVSCEYFGELNAFDEINVQMRLAHLRQHRIGLDFNIIRSDSDVSVAHGFQELACMRLVEKGLEPVRPPAALMQAFLPFA